MYYFKFIIVSPYKEYEVFYYSLTEEPTVDTLMRMTYDFMKLTANFYKHLMTGVNGEAFEDMPEEEQQKKLNYYYNNCKYSWEKITEEEFYKEV